MIILGPPSQLSPIEVARQAGRQFIRTTGKYLIAGSLCCWLSILALVPVLGDFYLAVVPPSQYAATIVDHYLAWILQQILLGAGVLLVTLGVARLARWFLPTRGRIFTNLGVIAGLVAAISWVIIFCMLIFFPIESLMPDTNHWLLQLQSYCWFCATLFSLLSILLIGIAFLRVNAPVAVGASTILLSLVLLVILNLGVIFSPIFIYTIPLIIGAYLLTPRAIRDKAY